MLSVTKHIGELYEIRREVRNVDPTTSAMIVHRWLSDGRHQMLRAWGWEDQDEKDNC